MKLEQLTYHQIDEGIIDWVKKIFSKDKVKNKPLKSKTRNKKKPSSFHNYDFDTMGIGIYYINITDIDKDQVVPLIKELNKVIRETAKKYKFVLNDNFNITKKTSVGDYGYYVYNTTYKKDALAMSFELNDFYKDWKGYYEGMEDGGTDYIDKLDTNLNVGKFTKVILAVISKYSNDNNNEAYMDYV